MSIPRGPAPVPALRVNQWLKSWDDINFDASELQRRPEPEFYLFTLPAWQLMKLSGIYRRSTDAGTARRRDTHIQRAHDENRSDEIKRYVQGGYPWSTLSERKRDDPRNATLMKPGWLPTAIVVNILNPGETRRGLTLPEGNEITVSDSPSADFAHLHLPELATEETGVPPIEIIDGQHRLYAFDESDPETRDYHLPVVAFHGLDISWQAYLFWVINIKPKKISTSLAFDLYPLLREQEWLDSGEAVQVYRESRAQELTEALWATPSSPWHHRINMLGGGGRKQHGPVTQAAFIRSLVASMVKPWGSGPLGGIFGGTPDASDGLAWNRCQQAAFLCTAWELLAEEVEKSTHPWAVDLRRIDAEENEGSLLTSSVDPSLNRSDAAFYGPYSLLATEQGVRGFQQVINDTFYVKAEALGLRNWRHDGASSDVSPDTVMECANSLKEENFYSFLRDLCASLAAFDWRKTTTPGLGESERLKKAAFRGSGGYKEVRNQLRTHLTETGFRTAGDLGW